MSDFLPHIWDIHRVVRNSPLTVRIRRNGVASLFFFRDTLVFRKVSTDSGDFWSACTANRVLARVEESYKNTIDEVMSISM